MKVRIIILLSLLFLTGCTKQTETINVTLPTEENSVIGSSGTGIVTAENPPINNKNNDTKPISNQPPVVSDPDQPVSSQPIEIPSQLELPVLFAQQAPFGNWDALHEEACEEASMIMAEKYFKKQPLTETIMEEEIQKIIKWQTDRGFKEDLNAEETVRILRDYYGVSARISREVSTDQIKYEIYKGNLVIIPAAGRKLGNPNFKVPGPIYHMLVVKGYNSKEFITNDPGTRKGNGYRYAYNTLVQAIHDWDHELAEGGMTDAEMSQGEKVIVIVEGLTK